MRKTEFDVAVIGGGSGGYAAARTATGAGLKTVVIEGGREVGGLCILRGCMPTKALLYAAEVLHLAGHATPWGLRIPKPGFDFKAVMARKDRIVKEFADHRVQQLESGRFKFIRSHARFLDPHTVVLDDGKKLAAKHFVIATGSRVAPPPLPQLAELNYINSDEALELTKLPQSLIVLGGGAIACEFAQFFARFGVKVTILQRNDQLLKEFDADVGTEIAKVFRREGIKVLTGTSLIGIQRRQGLKTIVFEDKNKRISVSAEEVLFALGRVPNTDSLDLDCAGVATEEGRVVANASMQTTAPHIYTAGDCTGPHEIVHIAIQQGEIAAHNIINPRRRRKIDYRLLLSVMFTDPQVASVGLTEKEAQKQDIPYLTASYPFHDHGKSILMEANDGFVKLLAHPKTGRILGGSCVGPVGGELIHEIVAAMAKNMTVRDLALMPHYHPTLSEIWTYPAEELMEKIFR